MGPSRLTQRPCRNSKACDACRARKIKCEYDGASCYSCQDLMIACTRNAPRKRRGPVNRSVKNATLPNAHSTWPYLVLILVYFSYAPAEAQRRRHLASRSPNTPPSPISRTLISTPSLAATAETFPPLLDQLGPPHIIAETIEDWFELVYCVSPILHRATLLRRLSNGDVSRDPAFCNLVISVCAATVSILKRARHRGAITVSKCMALICNSEPRGPPLEYTLEWCQTKYNLAVVYLTKYGIDSPAVAHLLAEAATGVRWLLYSAADTLPFISRELLKRLAYLLFAGQCTFGILGRLHSMQLLESAKLHTWEPLACLDHELEPDVQLQNPHQWHGDAISYIPGLVHLVNLFRIWYDAQVQTPVTLLTLQSALHRVQSALDDLPKELRWRGGLSRPPGGNLGTDVQIVNFMPKKTDQEAILEQSAKERQRIINDMLAVVCLMPEEALEVNGHILVVKLRDIGLALLNEDMSSPNTLINLDKLSAKLDMLDLAQGTTTEEQKASQASSTPL